MKIEFDGIADLREFLEFAGYEKRARDLPALEMLPLSGGDRARLLDAFGMPPQRAPMTTEDLERAIAGASDGQTSGRDDLGLGTTLAGTGSEPPKRKRRTKAELQAAADAAARADGDNAAAQIDPAGTTPPTDAQAAAATSPLAGANPFDASTSNEPAATAALNEAPAGATGTLAALDASTDNLTPDTRGLEPYLSDPADYIALRVAEMGGVFDAREHMKKCVEFIGALGKARYDEAFDLAGTSRAVASYTPADCAKHIAALEYLQIAG